ncbi:hypothetical protein GQ43DRAFT_35641 [Delitschia confertaspora ATCC 74209]|uniref:Uncharacterized protein n=1 Tax=Delitschia confertaspora ATCC 74209 TaxID=1513339 RepID=A0A9P4JUA3_9PLEO|nr:hypothetical protein GQ43DRAFT_35641 [Delitschia confertaspora ATCC 74209]
MKRVEEGTLRFDGESQERSAKAGWWPPRHDTSSFSFVNPALAVIPYLPLISVYVVFAEYFGDAPSALKDVGMEERDPDVKGCNGARKGIATERAGTEQRRQYGKILGEKPQVDRKSVLTDNSKSVDDGRRTVVSVDEMVKEVDSPSARTKMRLLSPSKPETRLAQRHLLAVTPSLQVT